MKLYKLVPSLLERNMQFYSVWRFGGDNELFRLPLGLTIKIFCNEMKEVFFSGQGYWISKELFPFV